MFASAAFVLLFAAVAISTSYYVTAALLVAVGIVTVFFSTTVNTTLQVTVPDELRGRVMSIFFLLFAGSTPIGGYLTGVMAESIGVTKTLLLMATVCAVGVGVAATYWRLSGVSRQPIAPIQVDSAKRPLRAHG